MGDKDSPSSEESLREVRQYIAVEWKKNGKPLVNCVDLYIKHAMPGINAAIRSQDERDSIEAMLRHGVAQKMAASIRSMYAALPAEVAAQWERRLDAELKNLDNYERHAADTVKHRDTIAESRRNRWTARIAIIVSFLSMAVALYAALKK
ncbi:hypothetical protein HMI51_37400 [Corallococcus coralloides]|nr:hypothetical protein [Corallococcus coralloides]